MGAKESRAGFIGYEDALRRVSEAEARRLREAFRRAGGDGALLSCAAFELHVLAGAAPRRLAERLYVACGGTRKGLAYKDLLAGLVLLTKGNPDEKIKFLWSLYCNEAGTYITKSDFLEAIKIERDSLSVWKTCQIDTNLSIVATTLFGGQGDKVNFETFRSWLLMRKNATVFSHWLLIDENVNLTSDQETPTFYQSLAGVTHLEERDICLLEKYFWRLLGSSPSGQLDAACLGPLLSPPVPRAALNGLLLALDENRDGHVDFKELCCGLSAACRGPVSERVKFCFKIFDTDRDGVLNQSELNHMINILCFVANESLSSHDVTSTVSKIDSLLSEENKLYQPHAVLESLKDMMTSNKYNSMARKRSKETMFKHGSGYFMDKPKSNIKNSSDTNQLIENHSDLNVDSHDNIEPTSLNDESCKDDWGLSQESFLIWHVDKGNGLIAPFLQLIFQVCHIVLGLRPQCKHQEQEIVLGWLTREVRRGYAVGQFWYLISAEWWASWLTYTGGNNSNNTEKHESCMACGRSAHRGITHPAIDEAIVCDENFNNSTEWMGDLLGRSDTGSLGSGSSSSGVSSNSSSHSARPGPIDNSPLLAPNPYDVPTLTGEGGHLKKDLTLSEHRDFELIPDSLWKALAQWYGGPQPLPRQVIQPPKSGVELELYPRNLRLMKHTTNQQHGANTSSWSGMVGGYGAAALSTVGAASYQSSVSVTPHRSLAYTAAFSRLATVKQVCEFICTQLRYPREDLRLWLVGDSVINLDEGGTLTLLEEETVTLAQLGAIDGQRLLIEVRNKDLTWPEEMGALSKSALSSASRRTTLINVPPGTVPHPPGATGLQNLGNTCFMNAALQAVWNTGPLTLYFTRGMHLYELNTNNPLGTRGALAQRYGELCKEVWNSGVRSVAPLRVRLCICQHADRFSGGGQHDSQELLAWLLDALHEDLNRVDTRSYSELRDSDGRPDQIVAQEAWEQHTARNQSIITELFYGQLKSKVTCTSCKHESVRFDAFNMLSLPLPMESYILVEILVILLDGSVPVKYGIRLNSEGRYDDLREALSLLCGVEAHQLLLAEVLGPRINLLLNLRTRLRSSPVTINLYAYELPLCAMYYRKPIAYMPQDGEATEAENGTTCNVTPATAERLSSSGENNSSPNSNSLLSSTSQPNSAAGYNCINNQDVNASGSEAKRKTEISTYTPSDNNSGESNVYSSQTQLKNNVAIEPSAKYNVKASPTLSLKYRLSNNSKAKGVADDTSSQHSLRMTDSPTYETSGDDILKASYLVAVHRKQSRQDTYFLSQHKNKSELFGMPLLVPISEGCSSKQLYTSVWTQVSRLLSVPPLTPPDQANHATDCDDSLGYTFPFTLRLVNQDGMRCAVCPWTRFCRGCIIPCGDEPFIRNLLSFSSTTVTAAPTSQSASEIYSLNNKTTNRISPCPSPKLQNKHVTSEPCANLDYQLQYMDFKELRNNLKYTSKMDHNLIDLIRIAIDWDPTALHLRYQSTRERDWIDHSSVAESRVAHAAAVQLQHCLRAFTSEERLEQHYNCATCRTNQPATKKLQIWRLPPILIIHLKRFQFVNNKWIKSTKVVDFPYKNFDPTAFLASVPQETILRHADIKQFKSKKMDSSKFNEYEENEDMYDISESIMENDDAMEDVYITNAKKDSVNSDYDDEVISKASEDDFNKSVNTERRKSSVFVSNRERLESTSLTKTPILDDNFVDYHQHKLKPGEDPFDPQYRLYAVVSHSGMMNGGHYVSYARNPSGAWYCYNDSSCKELTPPVVVSGSSTTADITPAIDPSSAYMLFYERTGLDYEPYLPDVNGRIPVISETELADGEDSDFKKMCTLS